MKEMEIWLILEKEYVIQLVMDRDSKLSVNSWVL